MLLRVGVFLFGLLVCVVGACDEATSCTSCVNLKGCSWCPVDGVGMCLPQDWNVCPHLEECSNQRYERDFEHPTLCRVPFCAGSTIGYESFLSDSLCGIGSRDVSLGCKACLGEDKSSWHCFAPFDYDLGFQCDSPAEWNSTTARSIYDNYCGPLAAAAPAVTCLLPIDALSSVNSGAVVRKLLDDMTGSSALVEQGDGTFVVNFTLAPITFLSSVRQFIADLFSKAVPSDKIEPAHIYITKVTLRRSSKKRQGAEDAINFQFSLLKNDNPAASDIILTQFVTALVQGVVAGVDPISVTQTPASVPQFPGERTNSTTPRPREVKPRDPTSPLNGGALFGIIFGSTLVLVLLLGGVAWCFIKYRASKALPFEPARATL